MEKLGSHCIDVRKIWCLRIFRKSVEKIQVSLKSDKNNGHFTWRPTYISYICLNSSYNQKCFRQKLYRKSKHILCSVTFFPENRVFCEIMWNNIVEFGGRPQMTIWRMRIAYWITKATNTYWEYVILIALPLQQWLGEHDSMLRYAKLSVLFQHVCSSLHNISWTVVDSGGRMRWRSLYNHILHCLCLSHIAFWRLTLLLLR